MSGLKDLGVEVQMCDECEARYHYLLFFKGDIFGELKWRKIHLLYSFETVDNRPSSIDMLKVVIDLAEKLTDECPPFDVERN